MADDRKAEHEARVKALNEANAQSAKTQAIPPTPTQEENDLIALGLMNIDDKQSGEPTDKKAADTEHRTVPRPPVEPARRS